ncbi:MAG: transposase family protein [Tetrasphaera jenkinsii]|nr:transposase family protein [Tetrasphaera jenkinsii]
MAAHHVTAAHRRRPIGAGHPIDEQPDAGKVIGITRDEDGGVVVVVDHGDHRTRVTWMALVKASLTCKPAPPVDVLEQHPALMLAELSEEERAAVSKRYRDLVQIETGSLRGNPEADRRAGILNPAYDPKTSTSAERLITKSRELKALGEVGASRASLYRQVGRIGEGPDFLIHGNRRTLTQRLDEFDPAVVEIVREEVAAESQRPRKSQRKLLVRIRSRLDRAAVADEVTRHQLGVLVGEVSRGRGLHHVAKTRRSESSRPLAVYGAQRVSRPGELVQVDATPTTVAILGPQGVLVPAVILSAIDVYTRWFVALRVCVGAATSRDVCALIAQMGRPTVTRAGYPYELEMWHGIPRLVALNDDPEGEKTTIQKVIGRKPAIHSSTLVFDHGTENASDHTLGFAAECGIDVVFCPPRQGHAKGVVEAIHRVIADVESTLPIHKGQNVLNRPNDLELAVPIKPQDLQDMLWEYAIDVYANEPHRNLTEAHGSPTPLSPAMVWADYVTSFGELDRPADPWLYLKGLQRAERLLSPEGIRLHTVTYNSSELQQLRSVVMRGIGVKARPLTIFYDRLDTTRIFLIHPVERHWMMVPRAIDRNGSVAPMSSLVRTHALRDMDQDTRRVLTETEIHRLEAALLTRWIDGVFTDRQDGRYAAIEGGHQRTYAHDLEQASDEVLSLAFPKPEAEPAAEPALQEYPDTRDDDEEFDYTEEIEFDDDLSDSLVEDESGWGTS